MNTQATIVTIPYYLSLSLTAASPPPQSGTRRISLGQPMHPPDGEMTRLALQKHLERLVPPEAAASLGIGMGVWSMGYAVWSMGYVNEVFK